MRLIPSTKRQPKTFERTEKASEGMLERLWEAAQSEGRVMTECYGDKIYTYILIWHGRNDCTMSLRISALRPGSPGMVVLYWLVEGRGRPDFLSCPMDTGRSVCLP